MVDKYFDSKDINEMELAFSEGAFESRAGFSLLAPEAGSHYGDDLALWPRKMRN